MYLFLALMGLRCRTWAFFSWGKQGLLFAVVWWLLTAVVSLTEYGL